jgi:hypothetical protein
MTQACAKCGQAGADRWTEVTHSTDGAETVGLCMACRNGCAPDASLATVQRAYVERITDEGRERLGLPRTGSRSEEVKDETTSDPPVVATTLVQPPTDANEPTVGGGGIVVRRKCRTMARQKATGAVPEVQSKVDKNVLAAPCSRKALRDMQVQRFNELAERTGPLPVSMFASSELPEMLAIDELRRV